MLAEHRPPRDAATVNEGTQEATQVTAEQRPRSHARRTALVRHTRPSPRCLSTAPTREPHPQSQTAPIATTDSARVPAKPHMLKYWRLTPVTPVLEHAQVPALEAPANVNMPPLDTAVHIRILDISRVAATTRVVSFQGLAHPRLASARLASARFASALHRDRRCSLRQATSRLRAGSRRAGQARLRGRGAWRTPPPPVDAGNN